MPVKIRNDRAGCKYLLIAHIRWGLRLILISSRLCLGSYSDLIFYNNLSITRLIYLINETAIFLFKKVVLLQ